MPESVVKNTEYTTKDGLKAHSSELHVNDMYVKERPMPPYIRAQANKASVLLEGIFDDISQQRRIQRDLITGSRIDPRKRHAIAVGLLRGDVDSDVIRPYYRRDNQPALPTISIIASSGLYETNSSYMERVGLLGVGLSWACEAVGIETTLSYLEGHNPKRIRKTSQWRDATLAYTMLDSDKITSIKRLNAAFNPNLLTGIGWNRASIDRTFAAVKDEMSGREKTKLSVKYIPDAQGKYLQRGSDYILAHFAKSSPDEQKYKRVTKEVFCGYSGSIFPSKNGGNGVHWARTIKNAEMVIAIGDFTDKEDADIHLSSDFDLMTAVKEIGIQARKLTLQ